MSSVNKVILIGNLGKDPEVKYIEGGIANAKFPLATSETWKDRTSGEKKERTEWHNIVLWRGVAEVAEKYLKKGDKVFIEGRIQTRNYEKDGIKRYFTEIIGDNMTLLSPRNNNDNSSRAESPSTSGDTALPQNTPSDDLPF